jgi:type I restriction-modification system DNA methylase subunit
MAARAKKKTATRKKTARKTVAAHKEQDKSIESWIWDAACSIRGAKDAPKYKDFILPLIFTKRLGLDDVEADIIGKSYEYLIRKFAEGGGQSAGEFYTPPEVGLIMAKVMDAEPGMEVYDPCCGSGGLLIKCEIAMEEKMRNPSPSGRGAGVRGQSKNYAPLKLYGQECGGRWGRGRASRLY